MKYVEKNRYLKKLVTDSYFVETNENILAIMKKGGRIECTHFSSILFERKRFLCQMIKSGCKI